MEKIFFILATTSAFFAFLIGDWTISMTVLAVFMSIDIISGVMKGIVTKQMDSKVGYKGFIRKGGIFLVIILANLVDLMTGSEFLFRSMAILFYAGLESLSIVENLGKIGVPLPEALTKYLKQLAVEEVEEAIVVAERAEHLHELEEQTDKENNEGDDKI